MSLSDSILITKVILNDDHLAFKILVERYQSDIRGLLLRLTHGNKDIVDDIAQESFIRVYKYLSSYSAKAKFKTWLFRIAYNEFYEYYNKNKIFQLNVDSEEVASQEYNNSGNAIDFQQSLKVLNQNEKIVIVLHFEKGFTHKEISKITNQPLGTVKTNIMRGKEKLKKFYNYER
jgi:RNA polymerase sigma-70 factor (ECF subfamily)